MTLNTTFKASLLVLLTSTSAAFSGEAVTGAALKNLITGFDGTNKGFRMTFYPDGNVQMLDGSDIYRGRWNVTNDTVCTEIKKLRNGAPTCRTVTHEGDNVYKMTRADNGKSLFLHKK